MGTNAEIHWEELVLDIFLVEASNDPGGVGGHGKAIELHRHIATISRPAGARLIEINQ